MALSKLPKAQKATNLSYIEYKDVEYRAYRRALKVAAQREIFFDLPYERYRKIRTEVCHYCECSNGSAYSIWLDRIDNTGGYTDGNVVPCCAACNQIRGSHLTSAEMVVFMQAVKRLKCGNRSIE